MLTWEQRYSQQFETTPGNMSCAGEIIFQHPSSKTCTPPHLWKPCDLSNLTVYRNMNFIFLLQYLKWFFLFHLPLITKIAFSQPLAVFVLHTMMADFMYVGDVPLMTTISPLSYFHHTLLRPAPNNSGSPNCLPIVWCPHNFASKQPSPFSWKYLSYILYSAYY